MKTSRIALYLAAAGLFSACAYVPPQEATTRVVSPDYTATGGLIEARAYVYGSVTLLDLGGSTPAALSIKDEAGASVNYERVGRYYRLARVVDNFTVWANGQSVTFSAPMTTRIFSAPKKTIPEKMPELAQTADVMTVASLDKPGDEDVLALIKLCESQLSEVRRLLDKSSLNPKATGQELFETQQRIDEIEARMLTAAAAIVKVSFPTGGTAFRPSPEVAQILIASAKSADSINLRGHTDSHVAGPADSRIALARAMAARNFLVNQGISPEKIKVFSRADGDFAAPSVTKEGKAMNRRVEIEFINSRIAELKGGPVKLAKVSS